MQQVRGDTPRVEFFPDCGVRKHLRCPRIGAQAGYADSKLALHCEGIMVGLVKLGLGVMDQI